jgi:hypothetical protein
MHRSYAASSALASSMSSNRFHPYGKPGGAGAATHGFPPSLSALGGLPPPPHLPPSLAGLTSAYSPSTLYALYGSRLAGGALP